VLTTKCLHERNARLQEMKIGFSWLAQGSSFPHVFSGNPGGIRTGPPIKAFGGDGFEAFLFDRALFSKESTEHTKIIRF